MNLDLERSDVENANRKQISWIRRLQAIEQLRTRISSASRMSHSLSTKVSTMMRTWQLLRTTTHSSTTRSFSILAKYKRPVNEIIQPTPPEHQVQQPVPPPSTPTQSPMQVPKSRTHLLQKSHSVVAQRRRLARLDLQTIVPAPDSAYLTPLVDFSSPPSKILFSKKRKKKEIFFLFLFLRHADSALLFCCFFFVRCENGNCCIHWHSKCWQKHTYK
jgi:hypothetical protein